MIERLRLYIRRFKRWLGMSDGREWDFVEDSWPIDDWWDGR